MTITAVVPVSPTEVLLTGSEALAEWRERHSLEVPGAEFMPLVRQGRWDGVWRPGKWCRQRGDVFEMRCSRGLAPRIIHDLTGPAFPPTADPAAITEFQATTPRALELRDYQLRAFALVLLQGWGRIAFATNAGKGAVIALLAAFGWRLGHAVLIACDEIAVYDALLGELEAWGNITPFELRAGVKAPPEPGVTLAMVPTLAKRLDAEDKASKDNPKAPCPWYEWLGKQGMLLLDEADKATSPRWRNILLSAKGTVWRAGFSGTFPSDLYSDLRLTDYMGPVLDRIKNKEMVERGVSAKPTVELRAYDATPLLAPFPKEWHKDWWGVRGADKRLMVYERAVVHNLERHQFIASLIQPDTPTAVVVNRIDHGRELSAVIPGAVFLDGSASAGERLRVLEDFKDGTTRVLVVTKILDRGTNRLGNAADLIFASGEGSARQTLQRIGRGLRRAGGKEFLRLVDIVDRVDFADQPDKRIKMAAGFLHRAAKGRVEVYAAEGFAVDVIRQA